MDTNPPQASGLLLVGHGTDDPIGAAEANELCRLVAEVAPDTPVELGFLDHSLPTVDDAVGRLFSRSVQRVRAVPLMLAAAGHVNQDIPRQLIVAQSRFPEVAISVCPFLGNHPRVVALSAMRYQQAIDCSDVKLAKDGQVAPRSDILLLVHRGSSDSKAVEYGRKFAQIRGRLTPGMEIRTCFLSRAAPSLDDELAMLAQRKPDRVIVQPHLLFSGKLTQQLSSRVDVVAAEHAVTEWVVAKHLGASLQLAMAVVELSDGSAVERSDGNAGNGGV